VQNFAEGGSFVVDGTAPTGTATVAPTAVETGKDVTVTIADVADDLSDAGDVVATVDWGTGAPVTLAAGATTATKKYDAAGTYAVTVTLEDEVGNESSAIAAGSVTVTKPAVVNPPAKDTAAPVVKVTKPAKKKAVKGKSWKKIKGSVTDTGSGPKSVSIKLVVKTDGGWKFFNGKKWKNAKNKKQALKKAKTLTDKSVSSGKFSIKVKKKAVKGKLIVQYWGVDVAGNTAKKKTISQKITK
jgi:hypothetical protein